MGAVKNNINRVKQSLHAANERGSRESVIEELFYDFNRSRSQVYTMNFVRGIFFGAGTVIGGTLIIALVIWLLTLLGNVIPPLGDFFDSISNILKGNTR